MRRPRHTLGQATIEYLILLAGVITPITFGLISLSQILWIWHSVADFTRQGAQYAATHCWQPSGENVTTWMRTNAPPIPDREQFSGGQVDFIVTYYKKNAESGALEEFSCDSECSTLCIPDLVKVQVRNYEYRAFVSYLGLPPVALPDFQSTMPIEGAGCDPEQGICNP
jgi:hypothetical protein